MADLEILTVGDTSDHGGQIITGDPSVIIRGKSVAVIGSLFSCPLFYPNGTPHNVTPIIMGSSSPSRAVTPSGLVALEGDHAGCGCTLKSANSGTKTATCVGVAAVAISVLAIGAAFLLNRNKNTASNGSNFSSVDIKTGNNLSDDQVTMINNRVDSLANFAKRFSSTSSPDANIPAQQSPNSGENCNCS